MKSSLLPTRKEAEQSMKFVAVKQWINGIEILVEYKGKVEEHFVDNENFFECFTYYNQSEMTYSVSEIPSF